MSDCSGTPSCRCLRCTRVDCPRCHGPAQLRENGRLSAHTHARYGGKCTASWQILATISKFVRPTGPACPRTSRGFERGPDPSGRTCRGCGARGCTGCPVAVGGLHV